MVDKGKADQHRDDESQRTPGAAGHPEPGSGHDDSKTVTVNDGPPRRFSESEAGAFGETAEREQPQGNSPAELNEPA